MSPPKDRRTSQSGHGSGILVTVWHPTVKCTNIRRRLGVLLIAKDHAGDSLLSTGAIEIEIGTVTGGNTEHTFSYFFLFLHSAFCRLGNFELGDLKSHLMNISIRCSY